MTAKRTPVSKMSPAHKASRKKTQAAYNKKPGKSEKRSEDGKARKRLGIPKGSTKDASRTKGGGFKSEGRSANRARGGKIGNKAGKAQGGRTSSRKGVKNR
jgi:hypothetical protein